MMKKTIASLILLASVVAGTLCGCSDNGAALRAGTAASTENFTVTGTMMSYYYHDVYNTFVSYYGSYVKYFGLDTTKSLREQEAEDGQSWYDYFMGGARLVTKDILLLCEAAKEDGVSLSEAEKTALAGRVDKIDPGLYGNGVNRDDIYEAKLLEALAYKYQSAKKAELVPSEAEMNAVLKADGKNYSFVDFYSFPIYYAAEGKGGKGAFTEAQVVAYADELAKSASEAEFKQTVKKILVAEDPDMSDKDIEAKLEKLETVGAPYTEGNKVAEWAFGDDSKKALILSNPSETMYTVYMLTSEPYNDESVSVNVRHVLLSEEAWGSSEAAKAKAEELLETYKSDPTVERFALMVLEYSDDESTYYNGGLYANLSEGRTVTEFNDWCFDPARKAGDVEVIETKHGWHLMLYEGEGLPAWQSGVADTVSSDALSELLGAVAERYPVTFNDEVINSVSE